MKITALVALISLISQGALGVVLPERSIETSLEKRGGILCRCFAPGRNGFDARDTSATCKMASIDGRFVSHLAGCLVSSSAVNNFIRNCDHSGVCVPG
ncbi:uncharacterized protein LY79DRAFT_96580 [Colletotrichum navitas]|uniref:Uncharacterized protein n=1 Tax=Colletotrichum navitas TaxID=681940 RepID=A0AAD8PL61_9PEZI|nr:uncharacterized protein LY79DRAFT_96580 [Colletotrichum navitas]KAK1566381.1 hypothetical protein LY79DRAFT_96580 [Colletotrichum navitas]